MVKNYPTLKNLVPLFFLLFSFVFINAQTANQNFIDVTNDITSPVCAGSNITVNFTAKNGDKTYEYYNNSSVYNVYISVAGTNNLILLKTYSTSGISYCGTDNCITTLQTSITIPTDLSTGSYIIRIYSELPEMKWYGPSNSFTVNSLPLSPSGPISGSRCGTGTVSLSVTNPGAGFTVDWYAASTGGSALSSGSGTNSFSTPNISSTTTYYAETRNTSTGCVSATRTAVIATVKTIPTITSNTPNFRCGTGTVSLSATASAGTINWYAASTGGVSLGTGTSYTTPSISATTTYYVDATNNGCTTTARTAITATVNPFPLASGSITGSPTVCQGQNTVSYSVPAITNATSYTWAYSGTGATISGSTASMTINFATNATSGNLTVKGTNACGDGMVSANYAVTVNTQPTAPTVGTITQPTCSTATGSVVLNGLPASGTWTLTRSPGTITSTGTGTSTTISGLTPGTYTYTVTNAAGCTSIASINVIINSQPSINTWNGLVSKDWNNAANWCMGVPSVLNNLDVLIPSALTTPHSPTISTGLFGYVENILFESGSVLTVDSNYLFVKTNLTLNGKIDLNGESQLLQELGSVLNAASTGTVEIDQQGEGNKYRYNYWSMPVFTANDGNNYTTIFASLRDGTPPSSPQPITFSNSGYDGSQTTPITLSTYWMFKYANSGSGYSAWNQIRSTGNVYAGQGFTMKGPGVPGSPAQNYVFVGKPNNGTIELTVAKDYDYLVGNPYPSALDADQFIWDNRPLDLVNPPGTASITGTLYFWEHYGGDTHNLAGYQGGYATYSLGGGVQASAFPGLGGGISVKGAPKQFIPVGQAFFVVGDAIDGGQIQFNNGQRVFEKESDGLSVFMKSSNTKVKTENSRRIDLRPKFRIGFDAPKISHRQLLFTIDERATPAVDWGFDAEIYEVFADDMYWMLNNKKYVIQATNSLGLNSEVPLGIQLSKSGMVTVKIDALENVADDTSVYLKDKVTGESFNMREKPVQLNLTAGKYADRFVLVFKTQKLVAEDVTAEVLIPAIAQPIIEGIHVFMNNALGELQIKNNSTEEITSVALVNTLGQTIKTWNSNFNIRTISLPISTATGVYLVQITTKTGKTVKKISVNAP